LREIAEIAYGEPARLPPGMGTGLEAQYRYDPPPMTFTCAAHACVVEVDTDTGFVRIKRWLGSEDCGNIINPAVVEGQVAGGLTQAIGAVLLEEAGYDERGNPVAVTYKDYLLPSIFDVPTFEYIHACTPSKAVGGFRGVGEGGAIIGPPTLFNAVADALSPFGEVPFELPLTPAKLLEVIEGRPIARKAVASAAPPPAREQPVPVDVTSHETVAPVATSAPHAPPVAVDGEWKMVLSTPAGPQEMIARLTTEGSVVKGVLESDQGSQSFEGTITGDRLKWDMKVKKPMPITLKYDLTIAGNVITGKVKLGMFGTANVTGERMVSELA